MNLEKNTTVNCFRTQGVGGENRAWLEADRLTEDLIYYSGLGQIQIYLHTNIYTWVYIYIFIYIYGYFYN